METNKGLVVESAQMEDKKIKEVTANGEVVEKNVNDLSDGEILNAEVVEVKPEDIVDDKKMMEEQVLTKEELVAKQEEFEKFQEEIQKAIDEKGIVFAHNGELLDRDTVQIYSDEYVILNAETRTPFIFDGQIIRYGNKIQAEASLMTLRMYTGNNNLMLMGYKELAGKSIL